MIELTIPADAFASLRSELLRDDRERCAVLFTEAVAKADGSLRLLANGLRYPQEADYIERSNIRATLKPEFVAAITRHAKSLDVGIVFVHSHVAHPATFSLIDDECELPLAEFLNRRSPKRVNGALVLSETGAVARRLGTREGIRIVTLGPMRNIVSEPASNSLEDTQRFDRQIRAFGEKGQALIEQLRIAVVGLGGTGSLVSQQLVHLGARQFVLVDRDEIEPSNLNRVANAAKGDVGRPKVDVATGYISRISPQAKISSIAEDVVKLSVARHVLDCDFIFCCTDSHGSRAILQQIAYQYLIPCIDMGVVITASPGHIDHIYGRIQALTPGLACLTCGHLLDPEEVRRDMMSQAERQLDTYIVGDTEPAPAVISINGTVSSLAVTMFLAMVTGIPVPARHIYYDALSSRLRVVKVDRNPKCFICSADGALARGDSWPLFARDN